MILDSMVSGIANNADKLAAIASLFAPWSGYPQMTNLQIILESIQYAGAGQIHEPHLDSFQNFLNGKAPMNAAMAYVAGMLIEDFKVPVIGKYGKAISKAAVGYIATQLITTLARSMTHSPVPNGVGQLANPSVTTINNRGYSY